MCTMSGDVHADDREQADVQATLAFAAAKVHGLPLRVVEHKRRPLWGGAIGLCYPSEGRIALVLRYKHRAAQGGGWHDAPRDTHDLPTLAHELAHLRYPNHSAEHKAFTSEVADTLRQLVLASMGWAA